MQLSSNRTGIPLVLNQLHRARLDFAQGLIKQGATIFRPGVDEYWRRGADDHERVHGWRPRNPEEVGRTLDDIALTQFMRFTRRKSQDFKWQAQLDSQNAQAAELQCWLEKEDRPPRGRLELDPGLELPDYYPKGFHHQPAGYAGRALAGVTYDLGLDVAFPTLESGGVSRQVPQREYRRILDLGCGTGRSVEPYAARFREAEVWGIDASGPMLVVAIRRADDRGLSISFRQALAEETGFPDGYFDLVSATILFHEVPGEACERIVREAFRVLAPGGSLAIGDELPFEYMDAYEEWYDRWQTVHNNEPYWEEFKSINLSEVCRGIGFDDVEVRMGDRLRHFADLTSSWPPFVLIATKPC